MKTIKDLTIEQAREIAHLLSPPPFRVMGKFEMKYQVYEEDMYEDARELIIIKYESYTFGDKIEPIVVHIDTLLNCWVFYLREMLHSLPTRNQYEVQKRFRNWGFMPKDE